jgi:hypothetical protein
MKVQLSRQQNLICAFVINFANHIHLKEDESIFKVVFPGFLRDYLP